MDNDRWLRSHRAGVKRTERTLQGGDDVMLLLRFKQINMGSQNLNNGMYWDIVEPR